MAIEFIHALLIGTSLLANTMLAGYVLKKKLKSVASVYYFLFMLAIIAHIAGDFFFQFSYDYDIALIWLEVYWIGFFFMAIFFFYFAMAFPRREHTFFKTELGKAVLMAIPLEMVYILFYSQDFIKSIVFSYTGVNYATYGTMYYIGVIYMALFMGLGLLKLYLNYRKTEKKSEKQSLKLVFIGLFFAAFFGMLGDVFLIRALGFGDIKLASIFIFVSCIIMSYVVIKHKIFIIVPKSEETIQRKSKYILDDGETYFVKEKESGKKKAYHIFVDLVRHKKQGLIISNKHPNQIRNEYRLKFTPIIWITKTAKAKNVFAPSEIDSFDNSASLFLSEAKRPVIIFDGLKDIIIENGTTATVEFLTSIINKTKEKLGILIFSLDEKEAAFTKIFDDLFALKDSLKTLEKRMLARKISQDTYKELIEDTESRLIEDEAELRIIEEEMSGRLEDHTELERKKLALDKATHIALYKISKRKINPEIGENILKIITKKSVLLEQRISREGSRKSINDDDSIK